MLHWSPAATETQTFLSTLVLDGLQLLASSPAGRRMSHSTDSADLPSSIHSSRWHLPYPIMLDDSIMEGAVDEENDVISVKGNVYNNNLLDGAEKITETSLGESATSRVIPAFAADEGTVDGKEVIKVHCVDDCGNDRKEKVEEDGVPMDGRAPQVGMVFKSYEEVVSFYKLYALRVGFGVAVKKSSFTPYGLCRRLVLVCTKGGKGRESACYQARPTAKTDCLAMIVVKLWGDGLLHLMEAHIEHNHPTNPSAARFLKCYKKMSNRLTKDMIVRAAGQEGIQLDDKEGINFIDGGRLKLGEGDSEAINKFFARMQAKSPNFFYLMDLDMEGHLRNVLWADARSRSASQYFGDVVSFDTTYLQYKFNIPLVLFVGTNHHGQSILLGCGLISEQVVENYIWLLKSWLTCTLGSAPNGIITDESKATKAAVSEVFPKARHRICLWRMMKSIKEKLKEYTDYRSIKRALGKVVFESSVVDEFEESWSRLIKAFGLEGNEFFSSLFEARNSWVPAFLKDMFWANMSTTRYKERISSFFEGHVHPETSLKHFFSMYEEVLSSKYETELQAEYESFHKTGMFVTKFHMEEQLSKLYTFNMFKVFQDELKGTACCQASLVKVDAAISTFKVRECAIVSDVDRTEHKNYHVSYNVDGSLVHCSCGFFQFRGILCRHALSVLKLQQVYDIPTFYIVERWRKDFKQLNAMSRKLMDGSNNNSLERYDSLSWRCLSLVDMGVLSDEKYLHAIKLIKEMEKSLLDGNMFRDLQRRLLPLGNRISENDENQVLYEYGTYAEKNSPSLHVKRRGRPPKRVKEANLETLTSSCKRKELDNLGTETIDNQTNMLQAASNGSNIGVQIRMPSGVNLMEEVNPNELSFGGHYGIHANHPDHIGNHSGLQTSNTLQFGQQNLGNQAGVQWIYQNIFQEDQSTFGRRPV